MNDNKYENHTVNPVQDRPDLADKIENKVDVFLDTKEHQNEYNKIEVDKLKNSAVACYIPFVCLYFIATNKHKESNYLKFHINQGVNITAILIVVFIISKILISLFSDTTMLASHTPGWVDAIIAVLYFGVFLLIVFGVINTLNGSSKELPIFGKIKVIR